MGLGLGPEPTPTMNWTELCGEWDSLKRDKCRVRTIRNNYVKHSALFYMVCPLRREYLANAGLRPGNWTKTNGASLRNINFLTFSVQRTSLHWHLLPLFIFITKYLKSFHYSLDDLSWKRNVTWSVPPTTRRAVSSHLLVKLVTACSLLNFCVYI